MRKITEQYVEEVEELKKGFCEMTMYDKSIQHMDIESFKLLQAALNLIDTSNKMVLESGEMMDEMNAKLDLLLKK